MSDSEYLVFTPDVFKGPGLERLVYLETRSTDAGDEFLSGNVGETPPVYSLENHIASGSTDSFDVWEQKTRLAAAERLEQVKAHLGLEEIALLRVGHGTNIARLGQDLALTGQAVHFNDKPDADAAIITRPGVGSVIAPADCVVATVAYPGTETVAQIHSGIRGMVKGVIPLTLKQLERQGLNPELARVYLSPHAKDFIMDETERSEISELLKDAPEEIRSEFKAYTAENQHGRLTMNLTQFTLHQLMRSGVETKRIGVSPIDTFADASVYSHFNSINAPGTANGRIAVAVGIKPNRGDTVQ